MQKRKGISLIVLVITIIVMIVLAGAIILSLNNAGIIGKSNQAVKDTDEANVKELAQMAWGEAYASGVRKVEGDNGLEAKVKESLINNGLNVNEYGILVTTKGVEIVKGWIQDKIIIKRGDKELTVGQIVKYKATGTDYAGEWKLLGADEDGNILIMSAADVKTEYKLGGGTLEETQQSWLNAITALNNECKVYAVGSYAKGARSITVEDIDKVTGYDKTTYSPTVIYKYGNEVTYTYNGTTKPTYTGTNGVTGYLTIDHTSGFYWHDEEGFHNVTVSELTNESNKGKEIAKITNTYYGYAGTVGASKLTADSEAYKMIFRNSDDNANSIYWLASPYVYTRTNTFYFGMRVVGGGFVDGNSLFYSTGGNIFNAFGVRAVVTLEADIPLSNLI